MKEEEGEKKKKARQIESSPGKIKMLNPASDLIHPPPTSPTASSISSSDLDTESTGSFFHDRSTTLGTLMGVRQPTIPFRPPSHHSPNTTTSITRRLSRKQKKQTPPLVMSSKRRRRWWRLCGEGEEDTRPASLGEFLDLERRYGDGAFYMCGEEVVEEQPRNGPRMLFADGRVLPPAANHDNDADAVGTNNVRGFGVLCPSICSGGVG